MKLEINKLKHYLGTGLKFIMTSDHTEEFEYEDWDGDESDYKEGSIWDYAGEVDKDLYIPLGDGDLTRVFRKESSYISIDSNGLKPILHPLSDLTEPIKHNGESFEDVRAFVSKYCIQMCDAYDEYLESLFDDLISAQTRLLQAPHEMFQLLIEKHFDVFGLIEAGLAIDINILDKDVYSQPVTQ